ncbi:heavy metal sensor histidine kinase [Rhodocyclus purpureus]|uniref:heavy metal sensor histidine kinase n=1 Tax=Rhodocyclus purpureus TaxID=1067 RepID=UPI0019127FB4|nr:heavy metal sensor histidine kinase [Rhodocyclus purpureus]MBK5913304.1 two-component sensor histidine kinase [Rhodocyclus purpureus]
MKLVAGQSLTARLTLLFASVSTGVLLLLGLLVGALVERHFEDLDTELLSGQLEIVRQAVVAARSAGASAGHSGALAEHLDRVMVGHHGLALVVRGADGRLLHASAGADFPAEIQARLNAQALRPLKWSGRDGRLYRGITGSAPTGVDGEPALAIALSTELTHHEQFMDSFRAALWSVVALAALLSGGLGWLAARRGLAPLRDIARDAEDITADRLDRRLRSEAIPSELAEVAQTLNEMLARLEASFRRLSDFSSDIAHELRTPVSNLLTQTQVTLSKARSAEEYREVLASNAEEFERLGRTIADMLFLAKADNQLLIPHREAVDLAQQVASLLEFYEALAEEKDLRMTFSGAARVSGDRLMLRRAIGNLLSNAVRHTPPHGHIRVVLDGGDGRTALVRVENTGETIAAEHLPRLFDRFYRADASRRHSGEGAGLGLAITRSIVIAHGGEVAVRSADGVTAFELRFPG